jgi:hypothetical protein
MINLANPASISNDSNKNYGFISLSIFSRSLISWLNFKSNYPRLIGVPWSLLCIYVFCVWVIRLITIFCLHVLVLHFNPWVEASAGGLLFPEGLYSPVAKFFRTCFKIRIWIETKFCQFILKTKDYLPQA